MPSGHKKSIIYKLLQSFSSILVLKDAHSEQNGAPAVDLVPNVEWYDFSEKGSSTTVTFLRILNTDDKDDAVIKVRHNA